MRDRQRGAAARADGVRAQNEQGEQEQRRAHAKPLRSAAASPASTCAAERDEQQRDPGDREQAPVELVGRTSATSGTRARSCGTAATASATGRSTGFVFATGFGFADRPSASPPASAPAGRARQARTAARPARASPIDRGAAHRRGLRPGRRRRLGSDGFRGGSGAGVAACAGTARTTHSSARPPAGVPRRRSNDHLPRRAISPRSPGLFHEATAVFETCQRGASPRRPVRCRPAGRRLLSTRRATSPLRSSRPAGAPPTGRARTGRSSPTDRPPACRRRRTDPGPRPAGARSGSAPSRTSAPRSTGRPSRRSRSCRRRRACSSCRPTGSRTCRVRRPGWPANRRMRPARSSLPGRSPGCRSRHGNRTPCCCGRPDPGRHPAWSG